MFVNQTYYVSYCINPKNPSLSSIVYISSNEDVLTINSDGLLIVNGIGKSTITIKDEITNLEKLKDS